MAAGDIAAPVVTAVQGVPAELTPVVAPALGVGVLIYATRRAWKFFKGLAS